MKQFKIYLKENYINNVILIMLSLLTGVLAYHSSKIMRVIFNSGDYSTEFLNKKLILFIGIYLTLFMVSLGINIYGNVTSFKGKRNYLDFILKKIFRGDYEYFVKHSTSAISSEIDMTINNLGSFYNSIVKAIALVIEFSVYFVIILNISKFTIFSTVIVAILMYFICKSINKKITSYFKSYLDENREANSLLLDTLSNAKNIKAKSCEEYFRGKILKKRNRANNYMINYHFYHLFWYNINFVFSSIIPILIIYFSLNIYGLNNLKKEEILILYLFIPLLLNSLNGLFNTLVEFYKCKPSLSKMNGFYEIERENSGDMQLSSFDCLKCNSVKVRFKNKIIIIPDMTIKKGDKVIIKGESGIGKSTLFNLLLGLIKDYEGEIRINNIDLRNINLRTLRELIGISFQNNSVYSMTLRENILLGDEKDINGVIEVASLNKLREHKKDDILGKDILSGGEKARISLAQNLSRNPDLILIDETTSGVDANMEREILEKILFEYYNKTIMCITHRESNKDLFNKIVEFKKAEDLSEEVSCDSI